MAIFYITRANSFIGWAVNWHLFVDGVDVISVKNNSTAQIDIPGDVVELKWKLDANKMSKPVYMDLRLTDVVYIDVQPKGLKGLEATILNQDAIVSEGYYHALHPKKSGFKALFQKQNKSRDLPAYNSVNDELSATVDDEDETDEDVISIEIPLSISLEQANETPVSKQSNRVHIPLGIEVHEYLELLNETTGFISCPFFNPELQHYLTDEELNNTYVASFKNRKHLRFYDLKTNEAVETNYYNCRYWDIDGVLYDLSNPLSIMRIPTPTSITRINGISYSFMKELESGKRNISNDAELSINLQRLREMYYIPLYEDEVDSLKACLKLKSLDVSDEELLTIIKIVAGEMTYYPGEEHVMDDGDNEEGAILVQFGSYGDLEDSLFKKAKMEHNPELLIPLAHIAINYAVNNDTLWSQEASRTLAQLYAADETEYANYLNDIIAKRCSMRSVRWDKNEPIELGMRLHGRFIKK